MWVIRFIIAGIGIRGVKTTIGKHSIKECGNAIIGNILSVTNYRISASRAILKIILPLGTR